MRSFPLLLCVLLSAPSYAAPEEGLISHNVTISNVTYEDRDAVRVVESSRSAGEDRIAILVDSEMQNGTISGYVSGGLLKGAGAQARGFVGLAFRIDDTVSSFEAVYLRPTNARAEDQLRRNHSIQYFSYPEFPWHRLRQETPAKYESYADMVPGEWIHYRLEVDGETARLFLNQSRQPVLIVNDLKLGDRAGRVGLWVGPGTEAHFSAISVHPR
jgi:hypothetical protein